MTQLLTEAEKLQFINQGFVVKKHLVDAKVAQVCIDAAWVEMEELSIGRERSSWHANPYLRARKGVVKLREQIANDPTVHALLAENDNITQVISELIGSDFLNCGVRGIYPTFPIPKWSSRPYSAHVEVHDVQVFVMLYLNNVISHNGGLYMWPGSHRVYNDFSAKFDHKPTRAFHDNYQKLNLCTPAEFIGQSGDAVFCHHRLLHSGSNNFGNTVRFGVLLDFLNSQHSVLKNNPPGPAMWEDWSPSIRQASIEGDKLPPPKLGYSASRVGLIKLQQTIRRLMKRPMDEYSLEQ